MTLGWIGLIADAYLDCMILCHGSTVHRWQDASDMMDELYVIVELSQVKHGKTTNRKLAVSEDSSMVI